MEKGVHCREIPIRQLVLDESNVRRKGVADLKDLEDSIKERGILEPLIVRPKGKERFGVVVGSRRYEAARALGLSTLPCIVRDLPDEEAIIESLIENIQRGDLDPEDETQAVAKLYKLYKSQTKVAKALGKGETWVNDRLVAAGLIETLTHAGVRTPVEIPRDVKKTADIARVAEAMYTKAEDKAKLLDVLGDKPREEVRRVLSVIKDSHDRYGKVLAPEAALDKAMRATNVTVTVQFDSRVSKAIITMANKRGISWEDVVRTGTEFWLEKEGFL